MSRKNKQFWQSAIQNKQQYWYYFNRLAELCISSIEWINLPDTCDARFLEQTLFYEGQALFFEDSELGYLTLKNGGNYAFNVYGVPINRRAIGDNGYNKELTNKDSVLIYNNMVRTPSVIDIQLYANKLWDIDRTIQINALAQKTPIAIVCDENERLSYINLYKEYDGNMPLILANKGLSLDNFKVVSTNAPYVADKLQELKTEIWNEALTYIGISNVNVVKKERLITDEVQRNLGGTVASRSSRIMMREEACKEINRMFGLDISVEFREDYQDIEEPKIEEIGGVLNE